MDNKEWFLTMTPLLLLKTPLFRPFRSSLAAGVIVQEELVHPQTAARDSEPLIGDQHFFLLQEFRQAITIREHSVF